MAVYSWTSLAVRKIACQFLNRVVELEFSGRKLVKENVLVCKGLCLRYYKTSQLDCRRLFCGLIKEAFQLFTWANTICQGYVITKNLVQVLHKNSENFPKNYVKSSPFVANSTDKCRYPRISMGSVRNVKERGGWIQTDCGRNKSFFIDHLKTSITS